ncbi:hypothetical protein GCM10023321_31210 [Pseudonocardia eucalypti]|uniref:Uncharacterized protein n=1 Tax=Pseudonocardia eucalypti TaxID=648755 RepID=A0ABP9Q306_9PSEU|nr:pimeloyl-ACP methyl ester carboxylesterase [Pseudonocardia eucalypti]
MLILWAEGDLWFARRNGRRLAREVPNGELRIVPDCRTFIPEDQPAEFAELVRAFLRLRRP